jgi:hypothetical protein
VVVTIPSALTLAEIAQLMVTHGGAPVTHFKTTGEDPQISIPALVEKLLPPTLGDTSFLVVTGVDDLLRTRTHEEFDRGRLQENLNPRVQHLEKLSEDLSKGTCNLPKLWNTVVGTMWVESIYLEAMWSSNVKGNYPASFDSECVSHFRILPETDTAARAWGLVKPEIHPSTKVQTRNASNWLRATQSFGGNLPREVGGVTSPFVVVGSAGSGTSLHIEDAALTSLNVLLKGYKFWFFGPELLVWARVALGLVFGADSYPPELLCGRLSVYPSVEQCARYNISYLLQGPGEVVLVGPGVIHTVASVTLTVAEACNLNHVPANGPQWSIALVTALARHPPLVSAVDISDWLRTTVKVLHLLASSTHGGIGDVHYLPMAVSACGGVYFIRTSFGPTVLCILYPRSTTVPGFLDRDHSGLPVILLAADPEVELSALRLDVWILLPSTPPHYSYNSTQLQVLIPCLTNCEQVILANVI